MFSPDFVMPHGGDSLSLMAFDRSTEKQLEQLRALYSEESDEQLLEMHAHRDDLTDVAQQALEQVMRERDLSAPAEDAAEEKGPVADPAELVYMFHDAFDAREAMRHLSDAGIAHAVFDWHVVVPEMRVHPSGLDLGLTVDPTQRGEALAILSEKLGLVPPAEVDEAEDSANPVAGLTLLAMFDLDEALVAARALAEAGISYYWRDGRDEAQQLPDPETVAIEVSAKQFERASSVVEEKLASR